MGTEQEPRTLAEVAALDALEGLISRRAGRALADLAASIPAEQAIVELGSFKGKSACYLATGRAHVWAVDAWDLEGNPSGRFGYGDPTTFERFEQQVAVADAEDRITAIKGFSTEVAAEWPGPAVGLLFIDADHGETEASAPLDDFRAWVPHLAPGAAVVFDDWDGQHPGVSAAIERLRSEGLAFELVARRLGVTRVR